MKLGLCRGKVAVEPHDHEWETTAQQTITTLKKLLDALITDAQHVGSTSVKGICAKPIIDIAVGVSDFRVIPEMIRCLEGNGFIYRGQDHPEQYLFVCGDIDERTHHIHVVIYGSDEWNGYLNMRDYLNSHGEDAATYSALKESLAKRYPDDRETYTAMKSEMISEILAKAADWRKEQGI
ncbi:MAG: GrpB family protein [Clostridia bacterium]|nr:GrpB family protein [Clostridia bacterium]